jgi:hypothetical protein
VEKNMTPPATVPKNRRPLIRSLRAAAPLLGAAAVCLGSHACKPGARDESGSVDVRMMADAVHAVLESDRAVYTKQVVNRLQNELGVIKATEHWKDDRSLPLPAQMFRMGAELASEKTQGLHYALLSRWAINSQNQPRTDAEKAGLDFVAKNPDQNYYGKEELGGERFFTAVYPDKAIANACVQCHNQHKDSPRHDFTLGEVMGGVVVRIAQRD